MADIPVERRSGGNWWKWVLGLLLVALAVWLIAGLFDTGDQGVGEEEMGEPTEEQVPPPTGDAQGSTTTSSIANLTTIATASSWQEFVSHNASLNHLNVPSA